MAILVTVELQSNSTYKMCDPIHMKVQDRQTAQEGFDVKRIASFFNSSRHLALDRSDVYDVLIKGKAADIRNFRQCEGKMFVK